MEAGVAQLRPGDVAADGDASEAVFLDPVVQLPGGEIGKLHGGAGEGDEAVRIGRAGLGQRLVLYLDHRLGEVAVLDPVPVGIDAQGLHIDALRVHGPQAEVDLDAHFEIGAEPWPAELIPHQRQRRRHRAVGMDVDRADTFPPDHDAPAPGLALGRGFRPFQATGNEDQAVGRIAVLHRHPSRLKRF